MDGRILFIDSLTGYLVKKTYTLLYCYLLLHGLSSLPFPAKLYRLIFLPVTLFLLKGNGSDSKSLKPGYS